MIAREDVLEARRHAGDSVIAIAAPQPFEELLDLSAHDSVIHERSFRLESLSVVAVLMIPGSPR
jgi:hypothetical protein